jgi:hypothetical protein
MSRGYNIDGNNVVKTLFLLGPVEIVHHSTLLFKVGLLFLLGSVGVMHHTTLPYEEGL